MGDDRRWAARYQFLEPLWRGRDRLICDRDLEAALHAGGDGPLAQLLGDLVPGEEGDARAWVALHNDRRAASFARAHSGTVFVGLDEAAELATEEDWQVALINLEDGGAALPSGEAMDALLEIAGERCEDERERTVVLTLAVTGDEDKTYEQLTEIVEQVFGDGRVYGLTRPAVAAFYDFGPVLESEGDSDSGNEGVGIEVDNTLGSETPRFDLFVAVVGAQSPSEGVIFVELPGRLEPSTAGGPSTAEAEELAALRVQLAEAQRRADMHAIERQKLLEQLEQAEDRIAALDEELESGAEPGDAIEAGEQGARLDEVLAREQSLQWELERVRGTLEHLRVRPVEQLEAELASTVARLEHAEALLADSELGEGFDGAEAAPFESLLMPEVAGDLGSIARTREWMKARARLDHVLRKLERGGALSALELHRELSTLRRLL